jgi:hypothetical protein
MEHNVDAACLCECAVLAASLEMPWRQFANNVRFCLEDLLPVVSDISTMVLQGLKKKNCFTYGFASKFLATSLYTFHIVFVILTEICNPIPS